LREDDAQDPEQGVDAGMAAAAAAVVLMIVIVITGVNNQEEIEEHPMPDLEAVVEEELLPHLLEWEYLRSFSEERRTILERYKAIDEMYGKRIGGVITRRMTTRIVHQVSFTTSSTQFSTRLTG